MIDVTIVFSPGPREVIEQSLRLPSGSTVRHAINDSELRMRFPGTDFTALACAIWGRAVMPDQVLKQGDRIELCRPLQVDPKVARRERFSRQGARATGLFAKRRSGGKAGY